MDMTIFDALPNAIISGTWKIGTCTHGSVIGNMFEELNALDVIIDEGASSNISTTPETLASDLLIYARPEQLPTLRVNKLVSSYMLYDSENNDYYEIVDAGIGKNQETGNIEHVELKLVLTDVVEFGDE